MEKIIYRGLKKLSSFEINDVEELASKYYKKLSRELKKLTLSVDVKKYEREGKKAKYAIRLKVSSPKVLTAGQWDWDLARALHKTFNNLLNEIRHKFKDNGKKAKKRD